LHRKPSNQCTEAATPGIASRMLRLDAKKVLLAVVVFVAAAVAHNLLSSLLGVEEPTFLRRRCFRLQRGPR